MGKGDPAENPVQGNKARKHLFAERMGSHEDSIGSESIELFHKLCKATPWVHSKSKCRVGGFKVQVLGAPSFPAFFAGKGGKARIPRYRKSENVLAVSDFSDLPPQQRRAH
jgi:hypothetical protein